MTRRFPAGPKFEDSIAIKASGEFDEQAMKAFEAGWRPFDVGDPGSTPHSFLPANMPSISALASGGKFIDSNDLRKVAPYQAVIHALASGEQITPDLLQGAWPDATYESLEQTARFLNARDKASQHRIAMALGSGDREIIRRMLEDELALIGDKRTELFKRKTAIEQQATREAELNDLRDVLGEIQKAPRLQKLNESALHKFIGALRKGGLTDLSGFSLKDKLGMEVDVQVFLVQHDWAAAFAKAHDYAEGEWRLPYEDCVFEFRISGRRFIALCSSELMEALLTIEIDGHWFSWGLFCLRHWHMTKAADGTLQLAQFIGSHIRAICIALDAEVATAELIRAPHKLNAKRIGAGKLPLFDHHVVDLSRRQRPAQPLPLDPGREITHRRMHFVRGHWRHYEAHKTWIKWHLRGNPDLGFIDKEYRL